MGKWIVGVAIFLVVAAIVIPNFLEPKISWNDWAAIAVLRNLATVEAQIQASKAIDVDGDGIGEFATFGEMTGVSGVRKSADGAARGTWVSPPILSPSLSMVQETGIAGRSGYCFRILLPAKGGGPVREGLPGDRLSGTVDVDAAEVHWCAYAWPATDWGELKGKARLHNRVLFVDEGGAVWQTMNQDRRYAGPDHGPSWDAAMPEDGWGAAWAPVPRDVQEYRGRDGNLWKRTN